MFIVARLFPWIVYLLKVYFFDPFSPHFFVCLNIAKILWCSLQLDRDLALVILILISSPLSAVSSDSSTSRQFQADPEPALLFLRASFSQWCFGKSTNVASSGWRCLAWSTDVAWSQCLTQPTDASSSSYILADPSSLESIFHRVHSPISFLSNIANPVICDRARTCSPDKTKTLLALCGFSSSCNSFLHRIFIQGIYRFMHELQQLQPHHLAI